jgi:hypothetical protein
MDKFPEDRLQKPIQEDGNFNKPMRSKESESVIKKLPTNRSAGPDGFVHEFY